MGITYLIKGGGLQLVFLSIPFTSISLEFYQIRCNTQSMEHFDITHSVFLVFRRVLVLIQPKPSSQQGPINAISSSNPTGKKGSFISECHTE